MSSSSVLLPRCLFGDFFYLQSLEDSFPRFNHAQHLLAILLLLFLLLILQVRLVNRSPVVVDVWGAHEGDLEFESVKVLVPEGAGPGESVSCQVASSSGKPKGRW